MWKKIIKYLNLIPCKLGLHEPTTRMQEKEPPTREEIIAAKHGEEIYMGRFCKHCKTQLK